MPNLAALAGVTQRDTGRLMAFDGGSPEGSPVVFLHGLGFSSAVWRKQFASAALGGHRLIALDLRGHGASGLDSSDNFDADMWIADLSLALSDLKVERPVFVAWSYSGLVLGSYLKSTGIHSAMSVCLVAAATRTGFEAAFADYGEHAIPAGLLSSDAEAYTAATRDFVSECGGHAGFEVHDLTELNEIVSHTRPAVFGPMLSQHYEFDELWNEAEIPLWFAHGSADRINLPIISQRQSASRPSARSTVYPGIGHLPFWERSEEFTDELAAFISLSQERG